MNWMVTGWNISIAGHAAYGCKKKIRFYVSGICLKLLFNCFKPVSYPFRSYKNQDVVKQARKKAEKLGIG